MMSSERMAESILDSLSKSLSFHISNAEEVVKSEQSKANFCNLLTSSKGDFWEAEVCVTQVSEAKLRFHKNCFSEQVPLLLKLLH